MALVINASLCACAVLHSSNKSVDIAHRQQWWLEAIHWDANQRTCGLTGKGVKIAVIDSDIDINHPDLAGRIIHQQRLIPAEEAKRYEHGTAVAGIICAYPQTSEGVLGVAPNASIISIVIDKEGGSDVEDLVRGIDYAISQEVDIINISAGIINDNEMLESAIRSAYDAGIVIVAASGNELSGETLYPAKYDCVISVDSMNRSGTLLYGGSDDSVVLPGGNIVTTYSSVYEPKKYISYTGTSMSCPILTGVIALLLEQKPDLSNIEILDYFCGFNEEFDVGKIITHFGRQHNNKTNN